MPHNDVPRMHALRLSRVREVRRPSRIVRRAPLTGVLLLLVDDDEDALSLTCSHLEYAGASVLTACSVAVALAQLALAGKVDVIISDIGLPGATGFDLVKAVRALGHTTPVIALTGLSEVSRETGEFADCITKPVEIDALVRIVSQLCPRVL